MLGCYEGCEEGWREWVCTPGFDVAEGGLFDLFFGGFGGHWYGLVGLTEVCVAGASYLSPPSDDRG